MSSAKCIQMILARQLASCVAMPVLLVDAEGTLIFYNESAEQILNQRFEETGEIGADDWNTIVTVVDDDHQPLPPDERPMRAALLQRRPISRTIWIRHVGSDWRHLQVTAFPLIGDHGQMLGVMNIFWEI